MTDTATAEHATATPGRGCALVFPGQGSQRPQMASPWRSHPAFARWDEAGELLGRNVVRLGTEAPAEELRDPVNCQIALFVHHAVLLEAWRGRGGTADVCAGHSLGEYSALLAAGIVSFADGLRLVEQRAVATGTAARLRPGGMVVCLGGDAAALREACAQAGAFVANDNADGQLVVAGGDAALERFANLARGARIRRLEVGAAYHSPHMAPAVAPFGEALDAAQVRDGTIPVISNVDARLHQRADEWPRLLREQLTTPVRWRETVLAMVAGGVGEVVELGASAVLTGLVKRTSPALGRSSVSAPDDLDTP